MTCLPSRPILRLSALRFTTLLPLVALGAGCARIQKAREVDGALARPASGATTVGLQQCGSNVPDASRIGRIALAFTGASSGEATVRLEGVAYKSTVQVDVSTGTVLELREGSYQLRITLSGYRAVVRNVDVRCGRDQAVSIGLTRS